MEWLKSLWARWKVQVSVVGGVLIVATAYGTCSVDPATVSDNSTTETIPIINEIVEVSAITETPEATTTGDTTTETTATTTE
jgi:hypothetical protein